MWYSIAIAQEYPLSKKRSKDEHNQQAAHDQEKPSCSHHIEWPPLYPVRIESSPEDKERYAEEKKDRKAQLGTAV